MRRKQIHFVLIFTLVAPLLLLSGCKNKTADLLLINGIFHTMDSAGTVVQAVAIKDGKIVETGRSEDLMFDFSADTIADLRGKAVYPGFIDAHCHFYGYAKNLNQAQLTATTSWEEVIKVVEAFAKKNPNGWVIGRGWDQNDWQDKDFPTNRMLNERFPNRPVILHRVDGHAAIANQSALDLAGITTKTKVPGGKIGRNYRGLTGILLDNAVEMIDDVIPEPSNAKLAELLKKAEQDLFAVGLTTVDDAGLDLRIINLIDSLQKAGELKIRVYAMANPNEENFARFLEKGPYKTDRLNVRAFKVYADGALGSRGACMLSSYKDVPGQYGFLIEAPEFYRDIAQKLEASGFQMNTHCIGDSANRMLLRIYGEVLKGKNDRRWRIEHAQIISPEDFSRFGKNAIWPSVQPAHATSDMYWAEDRIGKKRLKGAYAYKTLLKQNGKIAFGSDFPVENINPLLGFYAATARIDLTDWPYGGFMKDEALGRDTCLRAMTIWAAEANFEEQEKGSIEAGKVADLVVFQKDLLAIEEKQLPYAEVVMTYVNGDKVFDISDD